jgi:hypothetical protein
MERWRSVSAGVCVSQFSLVSSQRGNREKRKMVAPFMLGRLALTPTLQYPITPLLHYSITQILERLNT